MTRKRSVVVVLVAATLALAISQPIGGEPTLSIRLWVALTAVGFGTLLIVQLATALPVARATGRGASLGEWWRRRRRAEPTGAALGLLATAGIVQRATENPRTHQNQLRPRLFALADHAVPHRPDRRTERTTELIEAAGDVGWLLDPTSGDRAPTTDDIDRFLDRITPADHLARLAPPQTRTP